MSQEDVRRLLKELGGEASVHELSDLARKKYPDRTLHTYLSERLQPLEKKGFVEKLNGDGSTRWRLTEKGREESVKYSIDELASVVSEEELAEEGFTVSNLVGSLRLERQLDLGALSADIENTDYHPETYPSMIYRVSDVSAKGNMSVLTPSSGRLAIVGAKNKEELIKGTQEFIDTLEGLGIEIEKTTDDLLVQNIVANYDLNRELELSVVAITLELENVEYEPEQFPGLIYRTSGNSTVLIFSSGKCVITGAKTYLEVLESKNEVVEQMKAIGVEFDDQ